MQYIKYAAITADTVRAAWESAAKLQAAKDAGNFREIARNRRGAHDNNKAHNGKNSVIDSFFALCDDALAKYKALENQ